MWTVAYQSARVLKQFKNGSGEERTIAATSTQCDQKWHKLVGIGGPSRMGLMRVLHWGYIGRFMLYWLR